jgi:hypothetical protein
MDQKDNELVDAESDEVVDEPNFQKKEYVR